MKTLSRVRIMSNATLETQTKCNNNNLVIVLTKINDYYDMTQYKQTHY